MWNKAEAIDSLTVFYGTIERLKTPLQPQRHGEGYGWAKIRKWRPCSMLKIS